jgi:hypothetical protein
MSTNGKRLAFKITKLCHAQSHDDVVNALLNVSLGVLRAIPDQVARNQLILIHIALFIAVSDLERMETDDLKAVLRDISAVVDEDKRDAMILQHIRELVLSSGVCSQEAS